MGWVKASLSVVGRYPSRCRCHKSKASRGDAKGAEPCGGQRKVWAKMEKKKGKKKKKTALKEKSQSRIELELANVGGRGMDDNAHSRHEAKRAGG